MSDMRDAFERTVRATWSDSYIFTRDTDGHYCDEVLDGMWWAWQAARAQSGQEVDVVAWECSGEPGLYDNITRSKGEADHHRKIGRTVRPLVYGDTHPQPPKSKEE